MRTLLALTLLFAASSATAKCGDRFYEFTGRVVDRAGNPVEGAAVGVSWSDKFGPAGPALARTDAEGRYAVPVSFNTFAKGTIFRQHVCTARLEEASIVAYAGDEWSGALRVDVGPDWDVDVPELKIDEAIRRGPLFPEDIGESSVGRAREIEWVAGSEWRFTIGQDPSGTPRVVTMRVEGENANSCLGGDWKRLVLTSGEYEGLSEPAWEKSGDRLRVLLRSSVCDSYDVLDGTIERGLFRARHSTMGSSSQPLGTAHAVRVK